MLLLSSLSNTDYGNKWFVKFYAEPCLYVKFGDNLTCIDFYDWLGDTDYGVVYVKDLLFYLLLYTYSLIDKLAFILYYLFL